MARWSSLPDDVLGIVYDDLAVEDVIKLTQLSKVDASRVHSLALPSLLRRTACHHVTVDPRERARSNLKAVNENHNDVIQTTRVIRHNRNIEDNFGRKRFLARQIGTTWHKPCRPSIQLESDRLLVATGPSLTVHDLSAVDGRGSVHDGRKGVVRIETVLVPLVRDRNRVVNSEAPQEGFGRFTQRPAVASPLDDITGLIPLGSDNYIVSTVGGRLQRISLKTADYSNTGRLHAVSTALYPHKVNVPIESLSASTSSDSGLQKTKFLTAAHDGQVSLYDASSPWCTPATFNVGSRPWSSHMSLLSSQPYLAIGSSGLEPLRVYPIGEGGILDPGNGRYARPGSSPSKTLLGAHLKSAVYDIVSPPPDMANPFSNNPTSILMSAWFDGRARIHDLRVSGTGSLSSSSSIDDTANGRTRPVMEMFDPWSQSSLYSCAWTGLGNIATGSSRHGMVSLFDTRMLIRSRHSLSSHKAESTIRALNEPLLEDSSSTNVDMLKWHRGGYSVYTPGRPESPVYGLCGEGGRIWGVTDRRAFVLAFDIEGDQPNLAESRGWNIVGDGCRAGPVHATWPKRAGGCYAGGDALEEVKDYAAGYAMDDRHLRLFESLRGGD